MKFKFSKTLLALSLILLGFVIITEATQSGLTLFPDERKEGQSDDDYLGVDFITSIDSSLAESESMFIFLSNYNTDIALDILF